MAKLLCICGKIGCGKTYYANRLKEQEHAVILSTDEVTYDLTNNQQGEGYDEFARRVNLYLRKKAVEIVNAGCTVIVSIYSVFCSIRKRKRVNYTTPIGVYISTF